MNVSCVNSVSCNIKSDILAIKTNNVLKTVDKMLDLGAPKDILLSDLSNEEKNQALQMIAKIMKKGIIGYRYYIVDGKLEKHFIENELVDRRLSNAKPVKIIIPENGVLV